MVLQEIAKNALWVSVHWDLVRYMAVVRELSSHPTDVSIESRHGYILSFLLMTVMSNPASLTVSLCNKTRIDANHCAFCVQLVFQIHLNPMLCRRVIMVIISHVSRIQISCRRLSNDRNELSRCKRVKEHFKERLWVMLCGLWNWLRYGVSSWLSWVGPG